jgi:hypothetical protein
MKMFLEAHEQEMLVGSDPGLVAEKLEELYLSLPWTLRDKLESLSVADIYEEFRKSEPQVVDRILAGAKESEDRQKWCLEFWSMMKGEEEEEEVEEPEPAAEA